MSKRIYEASLLEQQDDVLQFLQNIQFEIGE